MLKFTEFDSVRTVQGYICLHVTVRFYNVQNENSNEISIPPMKLEHLALVLYIGGGFDMTTGHILLL